MEEKFVFKNITIPVGHFNKEGVICPFCKSLQKRYISHIRKEHRRSNPDISSNEDFEEFEKQIRNFIQKLKQREYREGQKEKDAEGFASKHKEEQSKYVDGQKEKDAEGFSSKQKEKQRKYLKAKRQLEPEKLKADEKKWNEARAEANKSMDAAARQFERETRYGPIFPCVCCHCLYFENQVVPFDPDKIEKKAREAHEKKQKEIEAKENEKEIEDIFRKLNLGKDEKKGSGVKVNKCDHSIGHTTLVFNRNSYKMIEEEIKDWKLEQDKAGNLKTKFYTWLVDWFDRLNELRDELHSRFNWCYDWDPQDDDDKDSEPRDEDEADQIMNLAHWIWKAQDNAMIMVKTVKERYLPDLQKLTKSEADKMVVPPELLHSLNAHLDLVAFKLKVHWQAVVSKY
jgi:hypothetical protein